MDLRSIYVLAEKRNELRETHAGAAQVTDLSQRIDDLLAEDDASTS